MTTFKKVTSLIALLLVGCIGSQQASEPDTPATEPAASEAALSEAPQTAESPQTSAPAEESEPQSHSDRPSTDEAEDYEEPFDRSPDEFGHYDSSEIYSRVCVTCHGKKGDGKGLEIELFSFGSPEEEWSNGPTVDGILLTLEDGVHDSSMRAFPDLSDADRVALAEYILDLREALKDD